MFSIINSIILKGNMSVPVKIQADITNGFPSYTIVGYLSSEVRESRERVISAIRNSGFKIPQKRIVINISPAGIRKNGTAMDLPVAIGILSSLGIVSKTAVNNSIFLGELSLSGDLLPVKNFIPLMAGLDPGADIKVFVPLGNVKEGAYLQDPRIIYIKDLRECADIINGKKEGEKAYECSGEEIHFEEDLSEINGQDVLKRGLEIAAAGFHSLLMMGPPGCGKSMTAERTMSVLPPLDKEERLEVLSIYSLAGREREEKDINKRPFISPFPNITEKSLTGDPLKGTLGELALCHRGVLLMDEINRFDPRVLDSVKKTMDEKEVYKRTGEQHISYPSLFMLVGTMNPCRCGLYPSERCTCSKSDIRRFSRGITGAFLDRIDLSLSVAGFTMGPKRDETYSSENVRKRVMNAWEIQRERKLKYRFNSQMTVGEIKRFCNATDDAKSMLDMISDSSKMSLRAKDNVLKVSRTIADINGEDIIETDHVAEALCYRGIKDDYWR